MARRVALYEIEDAGTGEVLSRHRTRQAAIDTWRLQFAGKPVRIFWITSLDRTLVVEGTWHLPTTETDRTIR